MAGVSARNTYNFKIVLVGNAAVGKSCLVQRFARDEFNPEQEATIGAAFLTQSISLDDGTARCDIWDTAGQERYRSLAPMYYRGAQAAIVVFSLGDEESFEGARSWVTELNRKAEPGVVIAIAGNKKDLAKHSVDSNEAKEWASELGLFYMETSAKTGEGVLELFTELAKRIPRSMQSQRAPSLFADPPPKKEGCEC